MNLEELKTSKKVVGTKQTTRALKEDKVETVFIAQDAEKHIVRNVEEMSKQKNINIIYVDSVKKLGKACSIDVGTAIAGILKK
ncbi:ribosomal L7Ae/L30e/S12e/Gadd45 family protein [Alkalithermobacter paradoxus]|uniref:Ribosome-associated protein L7Ae-like protein n=1 Tax=Alkalithermobacter paradoxus TaxID=29349 RepID=A0A1V4I4J2_9FIRM|nr:ribosome-associated protein L7Ae-like protein [[Clostridium] thermoalcaliphilum]